MAVDPASLARTISDAAQARRIDASTHARQEALDDGLDLRLLLAGLSTPEVLEVDDGGLNTRCLVLIKVRGQPVHIACNVRPNGSVGIITVYRPAPPKWVNPRRRGRS